MMYVTKKHSVDNIAYQVFDIFSDGRSIKFLIYKWNKWEYVDAENYRPSDESEWAKEDK